MGDLLTDANDANDASMFLNLLNVIFAIGIAGTMNNGNPTNALSGHTLDHFISHGGFRWGTEIGALIFSQIQF